MAACEYRATGAANCTALMLLAKSSFGGDWVWRKVVEFLAKLPACLVGVEACASAHYSGEKALHVLAYNLTRVMNIVGVQPLTVAMRA